MPTNNNYDPAPSPVYLAPPVKCSHCHLVMMVTPVSPGSRRFLIEHPALSDWMLEHADFDPTSWRCPNNAKQWVMEYSWQLWPVDPATGAIDTFGGRVI